LIGRVHPGFVPCKKPTSDTLVVVIRAWYERDALRARIIAGSDSVDGDSVDGDQLESGWDEYATSVEEVCAVVARAFKGLKGVR